MFQSQTIHNWQYITLSELKIQIFIVNLEGKSILIEAQTDDVIKTVKKKIQVQEAFS